MTISDWLNKTIPNPAVIYAAKKCGVKKIYKIGGAQAGAALAFGSKKIEKVNDRHYFYVT